MIDDPVYGYRAVNVAAQLATPNRCSRASGGCSTRDAVTRRSARLDGCLNTGNPRVLAFVRRLEVARCSWPQTCHSASVSVALELPVSLAGAKMVEVVDDVSFPWVGTLPYQLSLGPHASYWFQCVLVDSPSPSRAGYRVRAPTRLSCRSRTRRRGTHP